MIVEYSFLVSKIQRYKNRAGDARVMIENKVALYSGHDYDVVALLKDGSGRPHHTLLLPQN